MRRCKNSARIHRETILMVDVHPGNQKWLFLGIRSGLLPLYTYIIYIYYIYTIYTIYTMYILCIYILYYVCTISIYIYIYYIYKYIYTCIHICTSMILSRSEWGYSTYKCGYWYNWGISNIVLDSVIITPSWLALFWNWCWRLPNRFSAPMSGVSSTWSTPKIAWFSPMFAGPLVRVLLGVPS